jgi:hypothetical protein
MRAVVERTGQAQQHRPSHGLTLTLRREPPPSGGKQGGSWILSLTRLGVQPGPNEETICRAAFNVPDSAQRQELTRTNKYAKDYFITRLTWPQQLALLPAGSPAGNNYRLED